MSDLLTRNLAHAKLAELFEEKDGKASIKYGYNSGGQENHVVLLTQDGGTLGISTVEKLLNEGEVDFTLDWDPQWFVVGYQVHEEGAPLVDDHSGEELPSVYGDPEVA